MKHVRQRIEVGVGETVEEDAELVHVERAGDRIAHLVDERIAVVRTWLGVGVAGQRHRNALDDQAGGGLAACGRNQVDRAHLVVFTPASPVGEFRHPALDVCLRHAS